MFDSLKRLFRLLSQIETPWTVFFAVLALVIFLLQSFGESSGIAVAFEYGAMPARLSMAWEALRSHPPDYHWDAFATLFQAIFLHGDAAHIGNNLLMLWIFGSLVEKEIGRFYPIAFLVCGAVGNIAQAWLKPMSLAPVIGASGAVTGLEGIYLILVLRWSLPWPQVWPMARAIPPGNLAAVAVVGAFFDATSLFSEEKGIAFGAHLGGLVCGIALALLFTMLNSPPAPARPTLPYSR